MRVKSAQIPTSMRGIRSIAVPLWLLVATGAAFAQTPAGGPSFEVATVKPSPPLDMAKLAAEVQAGKMPRFGPHIDGVQADYIYMTLKELVANAYSVKGYQINGPAWLGTERFDIAAKLPDGASKDDAPKMLQALLADRFKLAAHFDKQEHPVLGLLVGKDGPKLKESPPDSAPIDINAPLKPGERQIDTPDGPVRIMRNPDGSMTINRGAKGIFTQRMDMQSQIITLESNRTTMEGFAEMLTNVLQMGGGDTRQVVDMTGLKGNYQVSLDISLAEAMSAARAQGMLPPGASQAGGGQGTANSPATEASDPGGGATVFSSVKRLGLKLEPRKASVEQLVIDHIEKTPAEN